MFDEKEVKKSMESSLEHFKSELKGLRTNRANPAILDSVTVEVYGTKMKLKDVANITVPEARQLLITPYDNSNTNVIAKAIEEANLNLQPMVDGNVVRINMPPMDESRRKEIVKICKSLSEDAKVAIREVRRKYNEMAKADKKANDITEDQQRSLEKKVQEKTDEYCKIIDALTKDKEKEILEI